MSACDNFVENVWSKGKCSNCFKSLTSHRLGDERRTTRNSDKCADTGANGIAKGQKYHTTSNERVARSNGLALKEREHVAKGGNFNRAKLPTHTKTALSTSLYTKQSADPVERKIKPALSPKPKPKPVPKPRQRASSGVLLCDQSWELCSRQTAPKNESLESERSTEGPCDSKDSDPGGSKFNTSEIKTGGNSKLELISSTKTDKNGEIETAGNKSLSISDKEQKTCTMSSSETNKLESVSADSSRTGETQYELGEEEYVPMKNNVFDMNTIMENCGADVLYPDRDNIRSNSATSTSSSDSVFDSVEDSKDIQNKSSVDIGRNSSALTSTLQKQVNKSNNNGLQSSKNSDKISTNVNDTKQVSDISSDVHETGPRPSLTSSNRDLDISEVGQTNAQNLLILSDAGTSGQSWESSSDALESSTEGLEAESFSSRQRSLGELKIKGTSHEPFGSKAMRQSNPDIKGEIPEGPVYMNSIVKPSTKPYKVVDVSTGMLVTDDQSQTPPLPRKAKDLVLDSVSHEYMEPTEGPCDAGADSSKEPAGRPYSAVNPSNGHTVTSSLSEPTDLMRHTMPTPRPRSQISSQSGTLPRAVPLPSKVFREEKNHTEDGKDITQTVCTTSCSVSTPTASTHETSTPTQATHPPHLPSQLASDNTTISASQNASGSSADASNMVSRPKRSAPTRPNYSPPVISSHRESVVSISSATSPPLSNQTQATQQVDPTATKSSSPKSAIKKAFTSMKRIGSKKRSKRRTLEISGPILVNEEIPSFVAQQEVVRQRALSEGNVLQVVRQKSEQADPEPQPPPNMGTHLEKTMSPPLPARRRQGYENYPFSQTGDTIERPQKPPRKARTANPLRDTSVHSTASKTNQIEEPAYLQPCEDALTFKVEAALANLNDAAILAEALSRVEQEKLGPLPAVPKSRHVRFQIASPDVSHLPASAGSKPALPNRPVSAVLPTSVERASRSSSSSDDPPELPSRPPNSKASKKQSNYFGRSQSVKEVRNSDSYAVKVARSQSLSTHADVLERRYNKILKLQMQTLEEVVESRKASLLPASGLNLSDTQWTDYEVCSSALTFELPGTVFLPVKCFQIPEGHKLLAKVHTQKVLSGERQINQKQVSLKNDLHFCESLPYHINTARVLTHFNSNTAGDMIKQQGCSACEATIAITDQFPVETLARFVERTADEHESSPERYERKVCFLLLQILSGLTHLAREGVLHCDLKLENLLLLEQEHLVISNFASACRESNICSDSDLGRRINYRTPELVVPAKNGAPLDYKKCDCFAVGCMIYKLLHRKNPFAANVALVRQDYCTADLPSMCKKSRYSQGLGVVACHLLHRDPDTRMPAVESLQLLQVLLWGPDVLDGESLESAAGDWLETERAHMVAKIARSQVQCDPSTKGYLETFLKCQFLFDSTEESVVKCYTLLQNV